MKRMDCAKVAMGEIPADMVIQGGKLVNVITGEIYPADVAIKEDRICYIGDCSHTVGKETVCYDAKGQYICPGLIDQHVHTYESQLSIVEYANAVVPLGITGIVTDFYGECVIGGVKAIRKSLDIAKAKTPLKMFFALPMPAFYQNRPYYHVGQPTLKEMIEMLDWPETVGLNDTFGIKMLQGDPDMAILVEEAQKRRLQVCGHGSELSEKQSNAWSAYVRRTDDHECVDPEELLYKARLGIYISMRIGSGCVEIPQLVKALAEYPIDTRRFTFNTDIISPSRIYAYGHLDNCVRESIRRGIRPIDAIRMGTLNVAECVRIDENYGSVTPGKIADLILVKDLTNFRADVVIANGKIVAQEGKLVQPFENQKYPDFAYRTVKLKRPVTGEDFRIPCDKAEQKVRAIRCSPTCVITKEEVISLRSVGGELHADVSQDTLKVAIMERTKLSGARFTGFVCGFGLKKGAVASTYNPHNQHLTVVGTNDEDMAFAVNTLVEMGGGFVVVADQTVVAKLELPLYGLLSDRPLEEVVKANDALNSAAASIGCVLPEAFHTLAFLGLPVIIGNLKITPDGLVDVWKEQHVDLFVTD